MRPVRQPRLILFPPPRWLRSKSTQSRETPHCTQMQRYLWRSELKSMQGRKTSHCSQLQRYLWCSELKSTQGRETLHCTQLQWYLWHSELKSTQGRDSTALIYVHFSPSVCQVSHHVYISRLCACAVLPIILEVQSITIIPKLFLE